MNNILKIVKSLEESGLLRKYVSETIKSEQKGGFLGMLLGILGTSFLGNIYKQLKKQLEQVKAQLEQTRI